MYRYFWSFMYYVYWFIFPFTSILALFPCNHAECFNLQFYENFTLWNYMQAHFSLPSKKSNSENFCGHLFSKWSPLTLCNFKNIPDIFPKLNPGCMFELDFRFMTPLPNIDVIFVFSFRFMVDLRPSDYYC